jgi:hypothetical protein
MIDASGMYRRRSAGVMKGSAIACSTELLPTPLTPLAAVPLWKVDWSLDRNREARSAWRADPSSTAVPRAERCFGGGASCPDELAPVEGEYLDGDLSALGDAGDRAVDREAQLALGVVHAGIKEEALLLRELDSACFRLGAATAYGEA